MFRLRLVASMLVVGVLSSGFLMGEDKKTDREPIVVKAQLPRYFKQLGLSDKQKKTIYKIRGQYAVKIDELQQQIVALKEKEKSDVANVLTAAQKARLKELQPGGSTRDKEIKEKPTEIKRK
jgi:hypothetical protein